MLKKSERISHVELRQVLPNVKQKGNHLVERRVVVIHITSLLAKKP